MPIETPHYLLECFLDRDAYSSFSDKRRFTTVDNQLNFIAEVVGNGRISGWLIQPVTFPNVLVTAGSGFVDKHYLETFNSISFTLNPDTVYYFYAQKRMGVLSVFGAPSDIASLIYLDTGAPEAPSEFQVDLSDDDPYFTVVLMWASNTEADFDHYELYRSTSSTTGFSLIATLNNTEYTDESVEEDTTYYYRLYALDQSGFKSSSSNANITTLLSSDIPPNPFDVIITQAEAGANIRWKRPISFSYDKVQRWEIERVLLNSDNTEISSTNHTETIDRDKLFFRFDELELGESYKITLYTIDIKNRKSVGFSSVVIPQPTPAPRDPRNIVCAQREGPDGVILDLSWDEGSTEYDPLVPYRYNIYISVDDQQESLAINVPIGFLTETIELYTYDLVTYFNIPQDSLITVRITSVSEQGFESFGNYCRFISEHFLVPLPVSELQASFDINTGKITTTWSNPSNTKSVTIRIEVDDLSDEYVFNELVELNNLGLTQRYVFLANPNSKYTISVFTTDYNDEDSPVSVVVVLTTIPVNNERPFPPVNVLLVPGDRFINLSWASSPSANVKYYKIYRKEEPLSFDYNSWTLIDTLPYTVHNFIDYGLENDTTYHYYITSVNIYNKESLHLVDLNVNLNFHKATPQPSGTLSHVENIQLSFSGNSIIINWESTLEEFDAYTIYRSVNNLYQWTPIATVNQNILEYTDTNVPLVHNTVFYYYITKSINSSDIIAQVSTSEPENSIFIGKLELSASAFGEVDTSDRRDIANLVDVLDEYTDQFLLNHKHAELKRFDAKRIDLNPQLIVTKWDTVDARIFTTKEKDITGTTYIVKIDNKFPKVLYEIDATNRRLVFSEPIINVDSNAGAFLEDIPSVELRVLGIEEVQGILPSSRFDNIFAGHITFGQLRKEQIPKINHEGRIREKLIPKRFLLERYSDYVFIVPQKNKDVAKTFGDGTAFFSTIESDGLIEEVVDFDLQDDDTEMAFRNPTFITETQYNLNSEHTGIAEVSSDPGGFQSEKSYHFQFQFTDSSDTRWVRISTFNAANKPNPVIDLKRRVRFRIMIPSGSLYVTLGIREISQTNLEIGANGGTSGPIEWVGVTTTIRDSDDNPVPIGKLVIGDGSWHELDFDLPKENAYPYEDGDGILSSQFGVLEHIAFTIDSENSTGSNLFDVYIDKLEQVDDVLVAGTSQGILISQDFGSSWQLARYVETPVHKFYKAENNKFLWAIATNQVLIATDPANWFVSKGLDGVQNIRDIAEDNIGNMYISTEKGVYWFQTSLIEKFSFWRQTAPIDPFTTDCYGLFHYQGDSGYDEIWVSTENGIYKTLDNGDSWQSTVYTTAGFPIYQFIRINDFIFAINRRQLLRKTISAVSFSVIADFDIQHSISDIWKFVVFSDRIYVSTGNGIYMNSLDELFESAVSIIPFERIFPTLDKNGQVTPSFGLDVINNNDQELLFIGQENRLLSSDSANVLSTREQFPNKELPSFYKDDVEIKIGYVYNAFNKVLIFREPQPVNSVYSSAFIPRKIFLPINNGWAQQRPDADIFIQVNGVPRWIDFKLNETLVLSEVQELESKLLNASNLLTDFNSLVKEANISLNILLNIINKIKTGGENNTQLINNETIKELLQEFYKFLSLINTSVADDLGIEDISIILSGFSKNEREETSRAYIFEQSTGIISDDSTGININVVNGEVDFQTVFNSTTNLTDKLRYDFRKHDHLTVSVFGTTVSNIGEFTHSEIEDKLEDVNTGLTASLAKTGISNLIKTGLFFQSKHISMFDGETSSNIQSKFHDAGSDNWYDKYNSTIDFQEIVSVNSLEESHFVTTMKFVTDNYNSSVLWVGTNNNIISYDVTSDGVLQVVNLINPGNSTYIIHDIYKNNDTIYVIGEDTETEYGHIFLSEDNGDTWTELDTINLPQKLYKLVVMNNNRIISTNNGVFFNDNDFGTWYPAELLNTTNEVVVSSFKKTSFNLIIDTFLIFESDKRFYTSSNGIEWFSLNGQLSANSVSIINYLLRFKNLTWIATDRGLYTDGNTVLSENMSFGLNSQILSDFSDAVSLQVNSITHNGDKLYVATSEGKLYRFYDGTWSNYKVEDFDTLHHIVAVSTGSKEFIIFASYNNLGVIDVTDGTGVFS